jgi:3-oxoisoapionate decarboxylase
MRLGISSYTYTWACGVPGHAPAAPLTALQLGQRALELGVGVVQLCENIAVTRADVRALRALGLTVEMGTRGLLGPYLQEAAALATEAGADFVRVVIDRDGHEPSTQETLQLLRQHLALLPEGMKIAIENHDRFTAQTLTHIIHTLGSDRVGITLDTVNSLGALETPEFVVGALAPYVLSLHVKDFTIRRIPSQMGFIIEGCPAGAGCLDLPWLLEMMHGFDRDPHAILELWTPFTDSLAATLALESQWAQQSVQHLRRLLPH